MLNKIIEHRKMAIKSFVPQGYRLLVKSAIVEKTPMFDSGDVFI